MEIWGNGEMLAKGIKLQLCRMDKSRELMHSVIAIVNNS